jgi:hypothetical protein
MQDSQPPTCNLWHILIRAFASRSSKKTRDKTMVTKLNLIFEFVSSFSIKKYLNFEIYFNIQNENIQIKTRKQHFHKLPTQLYGLDPSKTYWFQIAKTGK